MLVYLSVTVSVCACVSVCCVSVSVCGQQLNYTLSYLLRVYQYSPVYYVAVCMTLLIKCIVLN